MNLLAKRTHGLMNLLRLYPCTADQVETRLQQLTASVPCTTPCSSAAELGLEAAAAAVALDERMNSDPAMVKAVQELIAEGQSVFVFEVWCRYKQGTCPHPDQCQWKGEDPESY
jgi:hypothetical protein